MTLVYASFDTKQTKQKDDRLNVPLCVIYSMHVCVSVEVSILHRCSSVLYVHARVLGFGVLGFRLGFGAISRLVVARLWDIARPVYFLSSVSLPCSSTDTKPLSGSPRLLL